MQALAFSGGDVNTDEFDKKIGHAAITYMLECMSENEQICFKALSDKGRLEMFSEYIQKPFAFKAGAAHAKALLAREIKIAAWFDENKEEVYKILRKRELEIRDTVCALIEWPLADDKEEK